MRTLSFTRVMSRAFWLEWGCWLEHADRRRAGRTEDSREGDPFSDACADVQM